MPLLDSVNMVRLAIGPMHARVREQAALLLPAIKPVDETRV